MVFSLQRRFQLFILLPVAISITIAGVSGFFFARTYLFDQWVEATSLKLERAALQIHKQLNDKLELIQLIARAEDIPNRDVTQAFFIQQLARTPGVKFVDLDVEDIQGRDRKDIGLLAKDYGPGVVNGLYTMELCEEFGFCAPVMDPNALDRSLRIVKVLNPKSDGPIRRLVVRISFDSFMEPIKHLEIRGGTRALLVTGSGTLLAATDKDSSRRKKLGETADKLEMEVLKEIKSKPFGTVFGPGHPPSLVVGFQKVPEVNWYLVQYSRGSEIMEPIIKFRLYYGIAGVVVLLVIVLLIRRTTCPVAEAVGAIAEAAERVRKGDYPPPLKETRSDEIGQLTHRFNEMIEGLKERDLIQQTFGRYVDNSIAEELMSKPEALRLGGEKRTVTIMMTDLRNFTAVAEKLKPEEVIRILNQYFSRMISVVQRYEGIIVDFYGDSMLVFFNGLHGDVKERAADAVKCALEMQRVHEDFVERIVDEGLPELKMGIGIHTGEVIVGNIGAETRAKYGIVGSDVNLTDRIQSTAGGGRTIVSEETYRLLEDRLKVSRDFRVCLKGVEKDRELYEVESLD
ncbi:MAG: HAMP domain-containing protein [Desulfomonile sp.]|nr:HAMP domain-containing protein [Desulfomonile sp.]